MDGEIANWNAVDVSPTRLVCWEYGSGSGDAGFLALKSQ